MAALVVLEHVESRHGDGASLLSGVDLEVGRGELVLVSGAGGSGKSSLLRILAGFERPAAGIVRVAGQDLARLRRRAQAHLRRSLGVLEQEPTFLEDDSVLDNVALPARISGLGRKLALERAAIALGRVGLDDRRIGALACRRLAGSERRRAALARALANRPALLVLDEPLQGLDQATAAAVWVLVEGYSEAGMTVVCALREAPRALAARARHLQLAGGRLQPAPA